MNIISALTGEKFIIGLLLGLASATIFAISKAFFEEKGRNYATKQDAADILARLAENTKLTRSIEQAKSREDVLWRSELEYRQRQLAEFYGPAYGIIKSEKHIYDLWRAGRLQSVNFEVKKLFKANNTFLTNLIINKAQLVEGDKLPDSFVIYITNAFIFNLLAASSDEGFVPEDLANEPRSAYPEDFDTHIVTTTELLKGRIEALHKKYAEPLDNPS